MRSPASCSLAAYALALVPVLFTTTNAEITLEGPYMWDIGWPATGLALVDVDGDDHLDAVTAQRSPPAITIRHNDGNGGFAPPRTWKAGITPRYVSAGDFDGDGDIDLATPDYDGFTVSVMWNDGASGFERSTWAPLYRPCCMTSGDMNGDGRHELVIAHWDIDANAPNAEPAHVTICSSDPLGGWRVLPPIPIGVQPRGIQVGDIDGDGDLDVITANLSSHDVSLIFNGGDGRASRVETLPLQSSTQPRYLVASWRAHQTNSGHSGMMERAHLKSGKCMAAATILTRSPAEIWTAMEHRKSLSAACPGPFRSIQMMEVERWRSR
ncbi:MAG: FG-GAP-like repeat-containing protein [Phycisphaerales bacterium]|nr:FG-GAP-like repeat-containing protein [Phycisphaerales bacterium]